MRLNHWQLHEPILLRFETAWKDDVPPSIDACLGKASGEQRTELLAELVMIDFEHRCHRGLIANIDDYFRRFPELTGNLEFRDELLRHELQVRRTTDSFPDETELASRFPGDTTIIELRKQVLLQQGSGEHVSSLLQRGTMVGSYRIDVCVGTGAFASVYAALDTGLGRRAALKFLSRSAELRPEWRLRMIREAQAVASLQHPGVVPVFETGSFHGHDFIASRFVEGETLEHLLQTQRLPVREATEMIRQLASALEHAHCRGVVHRDIKPANIMVENGSPLLLDFGLAQMGEDSRQLTHEGDLLGTPAYMSPEQADGNAWRADARSDVYSLGAVLYRLVCGRLPFEGNTADVIRKVLSQAPDAPADLNHEVSRDLQTIILKCLQKEAGLRYQTAADLEQDLVRYLDGAPIKARPIGIAGRLASWSRRHPVVASLVFGVVALVLFLLGVGTQLYRVADERDRAQSAEEEARTLLAEAARDAGLLAMQRGRIPIAMDHFEQSLALGHPDRVDILLKLLEANLIDRNLEVSAGLWKQAEALIPDSEESAMLTMWRAELALEGCREFGSGIELMTTARRLGLPPAEQAYADGVLSESSPDAIRCLRQATQDDPFHHRARRLLIFTTFSLARFDDAAAELRIARQLFPEDTDFLLLESLCRAADGHPEEALRIVDDAAVTDEARASWKDFCRALSELSSNDTLDTGLGELDTSRLAVMAEEFNRDYLPLIRTRQWRFPPRIGARFSQLVEDLPQLLLGNYQRRADAIESLTAVHPEASLLSMLGGLRLADASVNGSDTAGQIRQLELSRDAFLNAIDHPGFLKKSDQLAWKAVFTTSAALAFNYKHEVEENQEQMIEAASYLDVETISQSRRARTFAVVMLMLGELDQADRWMARWRDLSRDDTASLIDAAYHTGILRKRRGDWIGVKAACDDVLNLDPNHELAAALRGGAMAQLREAGTETKPDEVNLPEPSTDDVSGDRF